MMVAGQPHAQINAVPGAKRCYNINFYYERLPK